MNVSACLVTRGDVDMRPILDSLPSEWEKIVWDNSAGEMTRHPRRAGKFDRVGGLPDLSVYGRYAAIEHASHDLIYVADDDVIVSDPRAIVDEWIANCQWRITDPEPPGDGRLYASERQDGPHVVCNMPQEFRTHYHDSALVGFGACFHRDAPKRAFDRMADAGATFWTTYQEDAQAMIYRECDTVFTGLTPRVLVDVPKQNLPYATDPDRLYRQSGHLAARRRMLDLVRQVRDNAL